MLKNILRCILFLLIFALLFGLLSPLFLPKDNTDLAGIHDGHAKGFLAAPRNSIDVLFVGDSETYSAFIPLRLWEQHGITSYVCSTGDQVIYQSYSYIEHVFREQSPRVVFLETNALYRPYTLSQLLSHLTQEQFPLLRYHDRWKHLQPRDLDFTIQFTEHVRDRGYAYHTEVVPADTTGYMAPSEELQPVPLLNEMYVRRIRDLCQAKGAQLILVSTPSPVNWNIYYHNGVTQLTQDLQIPYIDMNLMPEEIPIDWDRDSYDGGDHLNYAGACKVTDYTGDLLWQMGLFSDKRGENALSHWDAALADFQANLQ